MEMEQSFPPRTDGTMRRTASWIDLPPARAGLAAALRRAFDLPADETERQFGELLQKLC
jgi:hypothetical protein